MKAIPLLLLVAALSRMTHAQEVQASSSMNFARGFKCDPLIFPAAAMRAEATGKTKIAFTVNDHGEIIESTVTESSGRKREHKLLDHAALLHVRSCKVSADTKFTPGSHTHEFVWAVR